MSHEHQHDLNQHNAKRKPLHHQWWFILGVIVMLVAIVVYVVSDNLRLRPVLKADAPTPAAATPAAPTPAAVPAGK
jgi:hypothetical protein